MGDWADNAVRELSEKKAQLTRSQAAALLRKHAAEAPQGVDDDAWLNHLSTVPKYAGIDVRAELAACKSWNGGKGFSVGRKRFLAWLDKAERPLAANGHKPHRMPLPEPIRWRERLTKEYPSCAYAPGGTRANDQWAILTRDDQQLILNELSKIPA